jgi:hypothetical protein
MGVPNVSPSYPPYIGGGAMSMGAGAATHVGGYGTADNNAQVAAIANAHPWNLRVSPVLWAVVGLVVGLIALKSIHWREAILEGNEALNFGPAHERGEASVE